MTNNIFSNSSGKDGAEFKEKVDTHSKAILGVISRQKDVESSLDLINEKIELLDHNAIKNFKTVFNDIKSIKSSVRDLKQELESIKEFNSKMAKQIRLMSTSDEVSKLEKYIDLWNPMEFVTGEMLEKSQKKTVDELKKIIEEFMKK